LIKTPGVLQKTCKTPGVFGRGTPPSASRPVREVQYIVRLRTSGNLAFRPMSFGRHRAPLERLAGRCRADLLVSLAWRCRYYSVCAVALPLSARLGYGVTASGGQGQCPWTPLRCGGRVSARKNVNQLYL